MPATIPDVDPSVMLVAVDARLGRIESKVDQLNYMEMAAGGGHQSK